MERQKKIYDTLINDETSLVDIKIATKAGMTVLAALDARGNAAVAERDTRDGAIQDAIRHHRLIKRQVGGKAAPDRFRSCRYRT